MSLVGEIEKLQRLGENELPEISEGEGLFHELGDWLVVNYYRRLVSWRVQKSRYMNRGMVLVAEALLQGYTGLSIPTDNVEIPDPDREFFLLGGWRVKKEVREKLLTGGGLYRLSMILRTDGVVAENPRISLETSLVNYRRKDGVPINLANIGGEHAWQGGLGRSMARVLVTTIIPILEQKLGTGDTLGLGDDKIFFGRTNFLI